MILLFNSEKKLSIQTGCNNPGGTWKIEVNTIVTSGLVSTLMACADEDLMKQEDLAVEIFNEKKVPFEISTVNEQAILTVTDSKEQKHVFTGVKVTK